MSDVTFKFHTYPDWDNTLSIHMWVCEFTMYIGRLGISTHITEEYRENACEAFRDGVEKAIKLSEIFQEASVVPINFTYEAGF